MSTAAHRPIYTGRPIDYPVVSFDPSESRVREILFAQIILAVTPPAHVAYPSPLGHSLLSRVLVLAQHPIAHATESTPEACAYIEAISALGAYIRRLENIAQTFGDHLTTCTGPLR